jgi:hypothetical protein
MPISDQQQAMQLDQQQAMTSDDQQAMKMVSSRPSAHIDTACI